jgi:hypothetical protein
MSYFDMIEVITAEQFGQEIEVQVLWTTSPELWWSKRIEDAFNFAACRYRVKAKAEKLK